MKALTWQGKRNVAVQGVPDPVIKEPTDTVIRVTLTAICGPDVHLYELFGPFIDRGDILEHEPMGVVVDVGSRVGDDLPDERYLFLSDILPTAWQGVEYASVPDGGTLAVIDPGPVGQFVSRVAVHRGLRVLAGTPNPSAARWQSVTVLRRTSSPKTSSTGCGISRRVEEWTRSPTRWEWRRTAIPALSSRIVSAKPRIRDG